LITGYLYVNKLKTTESTHQTAKHIKVKAPINIRIIMAGIGAIAALAMNTTIGK